MHALDALIVGVQRNPFGCGSAEEAQLKVLNKDNEVTEQILEPWVVPPQFNKFMKSKSFLSTAVS